MRQLPLFRLCLVLATLPLAIPAGRAVASDLGWLNALNPFRGTPVDVHRPAGLQQLRPRGMHRARSGSGLRHRREESVQDDRAQGVRYRPGGQV